MNANEHASAGGRGHTGKAFVEFVLDQLQPLGDVRARRMFGGTGLYCGDVFFAIIFRGVLYLKVDERSKPMFTRRGMRPFKPFADRPTTLQYYEVPAGVLEDADELCRWARRSVEAVGTQPPNRAS